MPVSDLPGGEECALEVDLGDLELIGLQVEISKVESDIAKTAARRDAILDNDKKAAEKGLMLQKEIEKKTKEIEDVRARANKKDAEEIARRINEIYKDKGLM